MEETEPTAWIFVSHSSADLPAVRRVRNYLEERNAAPLLFHLKALRHEDEFWPIIEREIAARNFFLYCESPAAEASRWVRRERAAVAAANREFQRRIGTIRVDGPELAFADLDALLIKTRIFPSYLRQDEERIRPFLDELRRAGFSVFEEKLVTEGRFEKALNISLAEIARDGWVVPFISRGSIANDWVRAELKLAARMGARFAPVLLDDIADLPEPVRQLAAIRAYDLDERQQEWADATAPRRLVQALLSR